MPFASIIMTRDIMNCIIQIFKEHVGFAETEATITRKRSMNKSRTGFRYIELGGGSGWETTMANQRKAI